MSPSPLPEFPISASPPTGTIIQISVSQGGVPKLAVPQAHVTPLGLEGDRQAHPEIHGGPNRAVCLWSLEVITALQQEGHPIAPGCAGENITLAGLAWVTVTPGVCLYLGPTVQLEITEYTAPCRKNMKWFRDRRYSRISQNHFPGQSRVYARVLHPGRIQVGDLVRIANSAIADGHPREDH